MGRLDGKVAIVTGASRGIGKGIAQLFAAEGAKVVVCARTLDDGGHALPGSLTRTVDDIAAAGGTAIAVQGDVSNEGSCDDIVRTARERFGPVDILVNNAMWTNFAPLLSLPAKRWALSFAVNVQGPFMLSQRVLPDMIGRHGGAIVNISSNGAIGPGRGPYRRDDDTAWWDGDAIQSGTLYGATKAALERFTQGLAEEVYEHGVSVSCVAPSVGVATEGNLHYGLFKSADDPRAEPLEYMARAVLLLASEPLDRVTGRVTYSQQILKEFGWIDAARGFGVDQEGSGFSRM